MQQYRLTEFHTRLQWTAIAVTHVEICAIDEAAIGTANDNDTGALFEVQRIPWLSNPVHYSSRLLSTPCTTARSDHTCGGRDNTDNLRNAQSSLLNSRCV